MKTRALLAVLQLATTAADQELATEEALVAWFKRASEASQSVQEKRLLISGLGRVAHIEGLQLLASYLDDPDVKMEAAHAILNAAGPLVKGPNYAAVGIVLNRLPDLTDPRLRRQITELKRDIKKTDARLGDIDRMIQQNRMGELVVKAKPGAQVRVEQIKHEFWFGAAISSSAFGGRMDADAKRQFAFDQSPAYFIGFLF